MVTNVNNRKRSRKVSIFRIYLILVQVDLGSLQIVDVFSDLRQPIDREIQNVQLSQFAQNDRKFYEGVL